MAAWTHRRVPDAEWYTQNVNEARAALGGGQTISTGVLSAIRS